MNEHEAKSMMITLYDDAQIMKNHDADLTRTVTKQTTKLYMKNLIHNLHLTEKDAMDALGIPEEERSRYKELLKNK